MADAQSRARADAQSRARADAKPLSGMTIVVTRPRKQGEVTAAALRAAGAEAIELPLLEITPLDCRADLADAYAAIFVSANAVEHGLPCLAHGSGANGGLPGIALIAAIGDATSAALRDAGYANVVSPQQSIDSEGLLAMPQLQQAQVKGQHIILVRGKSVGGGRRLIEETLISRGARVTAMECYERRDLSVPQAMVESLVNNLKSNFAIMALSVETLESLVKSFAAHERWLKSAVLLVPHARVLAAARDLGFSQVREISMSPASLVSALHALKPH
ncbi:MAG: uroporphyrinogen-III synthase [Betaproteobacteria bacterium]